MKIEFYRHNLGAEEKQKVLECLDSVFLTTGAYVKEFEEKFAHYFGVQHAVGVTSCTAALHLALLALDIGPGDEVITTPMTFIATANAILYVGATPIFVDINPSTGLIDAESIKAAITKKTKAIIPVHLYGQMCDMKAIAAIAQQFNLKVVEDCAHSVESVREGIKPGQLSDAACFSFYATKNLTSGEGGAIITNSKDVADKCFILRQHGMSKSAADRYTSKYQHWDMITLGWKYNMSNIQAALLLPQLSRIEKSWQQRHSLFCQYMDALSGISQIQFPSLLADSKNAYHLFTLILRHDCRDLLLDHLNAQGIGCAVNYRAIHLLSYYASAYKYKSGDFPKAELWGQRTVTLPFWIGLSKEQVQHVAQVIKDFFAKNNFPQ